MNFTFVTGDLLASKEVVVAHGCNTQGTMGAGIAWEIARRYPEVETQYRKACGNKQFVIGSAQPVWTRFPDRLVFNLGTQERPGRYATPWGVFLSFANLSERCYRLNINRVAIPRIATGYGGLTWDVVQDAISEAIDRSSGPYMTVVVYDLETPR